MESGAGRCTKTRQQKPSVQQTPEPRLPFPNARKHVCRHSESMMGVAANLGDGQLQLLP
jgi:hypothetical protein